MKITSFNPMIITANADDIIKTFEALGFERRHEKPTSTTKPAAVFE